MTPLSSPRGEGGRKEEGFCFSPDTGICFQYNDAQLSGADGYAPKIGN